MNYVDFDQNQMPRDDVARFLRFKSLLTEKSKEGSVLLLYRGDELSNIRNRLFQDQARATNQELYDRLFYIGEKARHFSVDLYNPDERLYLTGINDCSGETVDFIFHRIGEVINAPSLISRVRKHTSERFRNYFLTQSNIQRFNEAFNSAYNPELRLEMRDYYLYFLHVAGAAGIRAETSFVSTSFDKRVAVGFAFNARRRTGLVVLHYFIPAPFEKFAIAPWIVGHHQKVVYACGLPTYKVYGLFPKQKEVSVKGALFPHFLIGVEVLEDKVFLVNSHLMRTDEADFEQVVKTGIPIDQRHFEERICDTGYIRWGQADLNGNFDQWDVK